MYYVLLVDDESAVTNALRHEINWEAIDLSVISVAESGMEAIDIIQNYPVDIVVTDIRMADMDGLSLVQKISRMHPGIQTIVISGYAEFSYVQKALAYGAIGYCLKPLEYSEVTRYLQQAIRRLDSNKSIFQYDDLLDAIYNDATEEVYRNLRKLGVFSDKYYVAVSVSKKALPIENQKTVVLSLGHRHYAYLSTAPFLLPELEAQFLQTECLGFAYSSTNVPVHKLGITLRQLSNRAFHFFFEPDKQVFADTPEYGKLSCINELNQLLSCKEIYQILPLLEKIKKNEGGSMNLRSAWQLYNILLVSEPFSSAVAVDDIFTREQLVFHYGTFQNMMDNICERLGAVYPQSTSASLSNSAFLYIVHYVDTHLSQDCSLQKLASLMNMNASYLGQLFKRETGKSYNTYVTELRIEKAKEMLDAGELSINDIVSSLGFNDYFYFLKTFKRVVGVTPKQYRNKSGAD